MTDIERAVEVVNQLNERGMEMTGEALANLGSNGHYMEIRWGDILLWDSEGNYLADKDFFTQEQEDSRELSYELCCRMIAEEGKSMVAVFDFEWEIPGRYNIPLKIRPGESPEEFDERCHTWWEENRAIGEEQFRVLVGRLSVGPTDVVLPRFVNCGDGVPRLKYVLDMECGGEPSVHTRTSWKYRLDADNDCHEINFYPCVISYDGRPIESFDKWWAEASKVTPPHHRLTMVDVEYSIDGSVVTYSLVPLYSRVGSEEEGKDWICRYQLKTR